MGKLRQVIGVGASAALLASLFTAGAASSVLAANSSSGGGSVLPGGTSAAGSITFGEDAVDQWSNGSFTVHAVDSAGLNRVQFSASSVLTVTRVNGVGSATAAIVNNGGFNDLVVTVAGTDTTKIDAFTVSGLKVVAASNANKGTVHFLVTSDNVHLSFSPVTASGVLASPIVAGVVAVANVTLDGGSAGFLPSGTAVMNCTPGKVTIAANGVAPAETFSAEAGTTGGTIVFNNGGSGFTGNHPAGTAVTQTSCDARFPSFVTVGDAISVAIEGNPSIFNAGVSRQSGADIEAQLGFFDGLLPAGTTVSFTIATAGVTYSTNQCSVTNCWYTSGTAGLVTADPTLSADLKTLTFKLAKVTAAGDILEIYPDYDVAAGVAAGTAVDVNVANSASATVTGNPATVAYVGTTVLNVTSTVPNVLIATTNQSAGVISLTESAAGAFTDSAPITICLDSPTAGASWANGTYFWAVVTKGDLKLNIAGLPASQGLLKMINPYCLQILDYTASTVASTIEIHTGSATAPAAGGPRINVWTNANPGPIVVNVYSGEMLVARNVAIAMAVFSGSPSAVALSQPVIFPGRIAQAAGSVQITEGAPGAFTSHMYIALCVVDQAHNENRQVYFANPQGANAPVVTTNNQASGLVAHYAWYDSGSGCIAIEIDSTSLTTLGTVTVSNLKYDVVADAISGPVYLRVFTSDIFNGQIKPSLSIGGMILDQTVSNATVQTASITARGTALGATKNATFTTSTKVAKFGQYVTWKASGGSTLANQTVGIYVLTKAADGTWSSPVRLTSRLADGAGNVYFWWRTSKPAWISVQFGWNGVMSSATQARWK